MRKSLFILFLIIIIFSIMVGCSDDEIEVKPSGAKLTIGVVGEFPEVNEENITFKQYTLVQINEHIDPDLDALFIMPENIIEAAEPKYADLYKKLPYPTFFIGSEKPVYAFINEDVTYESAYSHSTLGYTQGFFMQDDGSYLGWEFGLYNDVENEKNIKAMYTQVFETINKLMVKK